MFNPSREQVRSFFLQTWAKYRQGTPLVGLENTAIDVVLAHPEYRGVLEDAAQTTADYPVEAGAPNPFLHLSLHLAIEEQLSIDQPPGLRAEFERLQRKFGDRHAALHAVLECLGETVWRSQRDAAPPDALAYLECVRKK